MTSVSGQFGAGCPPLFRRGASRRGGRKKTSHEIHNPQFCFILCFFFLFLKALLKTTGASWDEGVWGQEGAGQGRVLEQECPPGRDHPHARSQSVREPRCHRLLLNKGRSPKHTTSANSAPCPFCTCLSLRASFNYFLLPPWIKAGPCSFLVPKCTVCHLWQRRGRFCTQRQTKVLQWLCHSTLPHMSVGTECSTVRRLPSQR